MLSIDGIHFPIEEPSPFSPEWSSHKLGGSAAVAYEIALSINKPRLAWVHGPVRPGKYNDLSLFRLALKEEMETKAPGRRIIGDKGYRGETEIVSTRNEFDPPEIAEFKDRVLARHETFNQRLKVWGCLNVKWRHSLDLHKMAVEAICALTMYQIDNGSTSLFDPYL
jgi:DDE superfamily endonuclease